MKISFCCLFSDRSNQRAHDLTIVRQVRRLLKESTMDSDSLKTDIRQQFKRLLSLESQSDIFDLLFHTDYLQVETLDLFINEIRSELEKIEHLHNPQEVLHLDEYCQHASNLLNIYRSIEKYRIENLVFSEETENFFSKEV